MINITHQMTYQSAEAPDQISEDSLVRKQQSLPMEVRRENSKIKT